MANAFTRVRLRREALSRLAEVVGDAKNAVLIHYSCESFYDRKDCTSPRITSIAVRNLASGQTRSFSIHQLAERDKKLTISAIEENYDDLEKKMLKEFYEYVEMHQHHTWLHWNMRDINYGFEAIGHRYKVLGGKPVEIHESRLCDLARLFVRLYGVGYAGHPRLEWLVEKNSISNMDFLNGAQEVEAFEKREYVRLHLSTLRKVDILANLTMRSADGSLKTNARRHEVYGNWFAFAVEMLRHHWLFVLIAALASLLGIATFVSGLFK